MPIAIDSPSAAVSRALASLTTGFEGQGFALTQESGALHLSQHGKLVQSLPCPVRLTQLNRLLTNLPAATPSLDGNWRFDATARQLQREGTTHPLTEKEALLLGALLARHPQSTSREQLLKDVWGMADAIETHTLETHIYRLRHKLGVLEPKPCDIVTAGNAYRLELA